MKTTKLITVLSGLGLAVVAVFTIAADHIDSPSAAAAASADIADFYAFESPTNADNTVFIVTLPDLTGSTEFAENTLIEINIDNNGVLTAGSGGLNAQDFEEDLVIQAIRRGDKMYFFGPYAPATTGGNSIIDATTSLQGNVEIGNTSGVTTSDNIRLFAGKRNDAFFFDFNRFNEVRGGIAAGETPVGGFNTPGSDFFTDLNVNAIVVEVPNSLLGSGTSHPGSAINPAVFPQSVYNVWVETKQLQ